MPTYEYSTPVIINADLLHQELATAMPEYVGLRTAPGNVSMDFSDAVTISTAEAIIDAHDHTQLSDNQTAAADRATNQDAVIADYAVHVLKDKTPAQIKTYIENQIDAWTTLGDARADLREWLPLIAAGIAWMVLENDN